MCLLLKGMTNAYQIMRHITIITFTIFLCGILLCQISNEQIILNVFDGEDSTFVTTIAPIYIEHSMNWKRYKSPSTSFVFSCPNNCLVKKSFNPLFCDSTISIGSKINISFFDGDYEQALSHSQFQESNYGYKPDNDSLSNQDYNKKKY